VSAGGAREISIEPSSVRRDVVETTRRPMKRTTIDNVNWTDKLVKAIQEATSGDVIEVASWHAAQVGHRGAQRLHGSEHGIVFEVDGKPVAYSDRDDPEET
jgi:hypothetical protein